MSFGKAKDDSVPSVPPISSLGQARTDAFLGKGTRVVGTLTFSGPVEIDGLIEGEIIAQDRLVIGESAVVKGKISGSEITVKGDINGEICASKRLSLRRPARVVGNISSPVISVEEGVTFDGKCAMTAAQKAENHGTDGKVVSLTEKAA